MKQKNTEAPRLMRAKHVLGETKLSRSSLYRLMKSHEFPQSIPLVPGGTSRAWKESDVLDWINERVEAGKLEASNV